ncbi:type VII secretion-associated serine protease mycosin [Kutzneria sp. CA-103260]|uniref:type VII secretion-associated serine protease mycosin n=1 Tax=Kutzneria sp. CA-103260 TaxID=2802641 RepID=UPI001BADCD03|nr:type VII secretion-associated serine protease mycosin [Kutzneria sp. CA-103260]QUQ70671.1 subtilisin-like serine protease [Kutzneria sp. CA-103260]
MLITRTSALAAAVVVGLLGPGLAPALAQDAAPAASANAWAPPPLNYTGEPHNLPVDKNAVTPGATYTESQRCVTSTGGGQIKEPPNGQTWLRLDEAHKYSEGATQTVAVIDSGVNQHKEFTGRLLDQQDYLAGVANVDKTDCDGHGTEVAGIIGADTTGMDVGFQGVAPKAKILPIRQTSPSIKMKTADSQNEVGAGTSNTLAYAILTAADHNATVINISLSACLVPAQGLSQTLLQNAIHYAVHDKGVVIVAAAGNLEQGSTCNTQNDRPDPNKPKWIESPAWFTDDVLSVAAIATDNANQQTPGAPASFSMWGPWVSVAGPGTGIITLDPGTNSGLANMETGSNGQAQPLQGTSFAAPYVAGLAALVKDRFPNLNAYDVMHRIEMTAQHPGTPSGRNNQVGYGMIDPVAALTAVIPGEPNSPKPVAGRQLPSDVGVAEVKSVSPMMYAMYGTLIGVALLLITLFVVHATNRSRRNHKPAQQRLRM